MLVAAGLFRSDVYQPPSADQEDFVRISCLTEHVLHTCTGV